MKKKYGMVDCVYKKNGVWVNNLNRKHRNRIKRLWKEFEIRKQIRQSYTTVTRKKAINKEAFDKARDQAVLKLHKINRKLFDYKELDTIKI